MSNIKLISYDLSNSIYDDYKDLYLKIESFEKYLKITESTWMIVSKKSCKDIFDILSPSIDKNDRLFISPIEVGSCWYNCLANTDEIQSILNLR